MTDSRWRALLQRIVYASTFERVVISLAALLLSILVGGVLILVSGRLTTCPTAAATYLGVGFCYDPITVFDRLFFGALGDPMNPLFRPFAGEFAPPFRAGWSPFNSEMAVTLRETAVLIFTGLSVAVAFRADVFNIGTQGQLVVGAITSAVSLTALGPVAPSGIAGSLLLIPAGLLAGAIAGGLYGAIPGALKAYADANEVITTIMLNFVAAKVALFLVSGPLQRADSQIAQTEPIPAAASIPSVLFDARTGFSLVALAVAVCTALACYYLLNHTTLGYELRTSGLQAAAARYAGVKTDRTIVGSLVLSGALGGLGGAIYVMMIVGDFQTGVPSYGFDGITVAILAGSNPLGVLLAAPLFGIIQSGSIVIDTTTNVPPQLVDVLRGLIVLFVAMPEFFRQFGRRFFEDDGGEIDG
ncbi:ABC transporter permease [Halocatena halophila]|uniref:ABC transporter permease n=1 Tax=Halocatena halophila TaxID=2814576 RepID=UPI002ED3C890